jgi:hypothetical protein
LTVFSSGALGILAGGLLAEKHGRGINKGEVLVLMAVLKVEYLFFWFESL